ncbi:MAG: DUF1648 domain-containing protein [Coriobacteriaceae bacterium]|nr:DUF1648 domain-containing protein [Coriobacteriaceae bacterium]
MFKYGKKAGILSIVLLIVAVVPLVFALLYVPQLPAQIPAGFDGGEVTRWASRWSLFVAPVLSFLLCGATYVSAGKQADGHRGEPVMARATAERFLRNGVLTGVVLGVVTFYMYYTAVTGHGLF